MDSLLFYVTNNLLPLTTDPTLATIPSSETSRTGTQSNIDLSLYLKVSKFTLSSNGGVVINDDTCVTCDTDTCYKSSPNHTNKPDCRQTYTSTTSFVTKGDTSNCDQVIPANQDQTVSTFPTNSSCGQSNCDPEVPPECPIPICLPVSSESSTSKSNVKSSSVTSTMSGNCVQSLSARQCDSYAPSIKKIDPFSKFVNTPTPNNPYKSSVTVKASPLSSALSVEVVNAITQLQAGIETVQQSPYGNVHTVVPTKNCTLARVRPTTQACVTTSTSPTTTCPPSVTTCPSTPTNPTTTCSPTCSTPTTTCLSENCSLLTVTIRENDVHQLVLNYEVSVVDSHTGKSTRSFELVVDGTWASLLAKTVNTNVIAPLLLQRKTHHKAYAETIAKYIIGARLNIGDNNIPDINCVGTCFVTGLCLYLGLSVGVLKIDDLNWISHFGLSSVPGITLSIIRGIDAGIPSLTTLKSKIDAAPTTMLAYGPILTVDIVTEYLYAIHDITNCQWLAGVLGWTRNWGNVIKDAQISVNDTTATTETMDTTYEAYLALHTQINDLVTRPIWQNRIAIAALNKDNL
jgi:hypothetical protein